MLLCRLAGLARVIRMDKCIDYRSREKIKCEIAWRMAR